MRFNDPEHNRAVYGDKFDPTLSEIMERTRQSPWTPTRAEVAALVTEIERLREALHWIAHEGGAQGCGYREAEEVARAVLKREGA